VSLGTLAMFCIGYAIAKVVEALSIQKDKYR
jgi:hypothetical protein